jgi:hypothetical protein
VVLAAVGVVGSALADDGNDRVLRSELVGNLRPAEGGATVFGGLPAGASWVVASSDVDVRRDGRIKVKFEGLLVRPARADPPYFAVTGA